MARWSASSIWRVRCVVGVGRVKALRHRVASTVPRNCGAAPLNAARVDPSGASTRNQSPVPPRPNDDPAGHCPPRPRDQTRVETVTW